MAVQVVNGCKRFSLKSPPILNNLNLSVQQGSIYGLLGASGCGKTTLLSCIVGLKKLDSGEISVLGGRPEPGSLLGYMPQDIALISIFTIKEMLTYFGRIYGMTYASIAERIQFLTEFLELPDTSKLIANLSGGQLRRVSFSVALIHNPPLIVLDEPTVGLDPVLRQSIWEHLGALVACEKTSIIVSTHYIDEAKFCDTVGILRKGALLAEDSPQSLLALHHSSSLEKVVLQLCHDAAARRLSNLKNNNYSNKNERLTTEHFTFIGVELTRVRKLSNGNFGGDDVLDVKKMNNGKLQIIRKMEQSGWKKDLRIVGALMSKTLLRQIRHPAAIFVQLLLPLLEILAYENIVGLEPKGAIMGVVSSDWNEIRGTHRVNTTTMNEFLRYCSTLYGEGSCLLNAGDDGMSSICGFLNEFEKDEIRWTYKYSTNEALKSIHGGKAMGFIEFPANFSGHLRDRILEKNYIGNGTLLGSKINIRMDESNVLTRDWVHATIMKKYQAYLEKSVIKCDADPRTVQLPLNHHAIYGKYDGEWTLFLQPGLIILYMFILANLPSVIFVMEKREGVADRGAVTGIKFGHIVVASFVSDSFMIVGQIAVFFIVLPGFYGMKVEGSWVLAVGLVYLTALSGLACGLWWATMVHHEMELILVLLFVNITNLISTGNMWPLESVSSIYRIFCWSLPASIPMQALRSIMFKGWGLNHPQVYQGFLVAIFWIVIPILLSFLFVRLRK